MGTRFWSGALAVLVLGTMVACGRDGESGDGGRQNPPQRPLGNMPKWVAAQTIQPEFTELNYPETKKWPRALYSLQTYEFYVASAADESGTDVSVWRDVTDNGILESGTVLGPISKYPSDPQTKVSGRYPTLKHTSDRVLRVPFEVDTENDKLYGEHFLSSTSSTDVSSLKFYIGLMVEKFTDWAEFLKPNFIFSQEQLYKGPNGSVILEREEYSKQGGRFIYGRGRFFYYWRSNSREEYSVATRDEALFQEAFAWMANSELFNKSPGIDKMVVAERIATWRSGREQFEKLKKCAPGVYIHSCLK